MGITWKKLTHINPAKNDELVKEKKIREELLVKWQFINRSFSACSVYGWWMSFIMGWSMQPGRTDQRIKIPIKNKFEI